MKKGVRFAGVVLDTEGNPIKAASVSLTGAGLENFPLTLAARTDTDRYGYFYLYDTPRGSAVFSITADGFKAVQEITLPTQAGDQKIVLERASPDSQSRMSFVPLLLASYSGKVIDAKSGNPVRSFSVTPGIGFKSGNDTNQTEWFPGYARRVVNGQHSGLTDVEQSAGNPAGKFIYSPPPVLAGTNARPVRLRIEAEGYTSLESEWLFPSTNHAWTIFQLSPGRPHLPGKTEPR